MISVLFAVLTLLTGGSQAATPPIIRLHQGYITRLNCQGNLLFVGVGDPHLVEHQELPKELGCTVIVKPVGKSGRTNLVLESSAGSFMAILEVVASPPADPDALTVSVGGVHE